MYEIVLQLSDETAAELQGRSIPSRVSRVLLEAADESNVSLVAQHPGIADAELSRYYSVAAPDRATADRVRERFATLPGVEACYVKPPAEPP